MIEKGEIESGGTGGGGWGSRTERRRAADVSGLPKGSDGRERGRSHVVACVSIML